MTKIQEQLLILIQEIDKICRKHDIPYYLSGGCVIGSIRHKGFIPWDDDIDILLDSKYWEKFYSVFQAEMPENRMLGCLDNNEKFPNMIYRYCDTSTTEIHKNELFGDSTAGVVIDIILMDSIPSGQDAWEEHLKNLLLFSDLINVYYIYSSRFNFNIPYTKYLFLSKVLGRKRVLTMLEKRLRKYEDQDCDCYMVRWGAGPTVFPKSIFGTPRYVDFAGVSLPIPEHAEDFLLELYGDEWVEVPMPDNQISHNTISDYERSYEEYFKEYVPRIGYDTAVRKNEQFKKHYLKYKKDQNNDIKTSWSVEGLKEKYILENKIQNEGLDPVFMFKNGQYQELINLFQPYMLRQGNGDYIGGEFWSGLMRRYDPVYIDLGDEIFSIILWLWIYQGRLSKAYKVLRARRLAKGEKMEPVLEAVQAFIQDVREAVRLYETGNYEESLKRVKKLIESAPCPVVNLWKLRIRLERILGKDDPKKEEEWICQCLIHAPEDGELIKYRTDRLYAEKGIAQAYSDYLYAYEHTRNGIVWLELEEIFKKEYPWAEEQIQNCIRDEKYETGLKLSEGWSSFCEDSVLLKYFCCVCKGGISALRCEAEEMVRNYVVEYPEETRFEELFKELQEKEGKDSRYTDYEIRMLRAKDYETYKKIQEDLCADDRTGSSLKKLELQSILCRALGDKKQELDLYRSMISQNHESSYAYGMLLEDMWQMIKAMRDTKNGKLRNVLLEEWNWKYPDAEECADLLIKTGVFVESERKQAELWIRGFNGDKEEQKDSFNNTWKALFEYRNRENAINEM